MADASGTKVEAAMAPAGPEGQRYLASGRALSMRLWEGEAGGTEKEPVRRDSRPRLRPPKRTIGMPSDPVSRG